MDLVKKFFEKYGLVRHQFESFHDFVHNGIEDVINDEPNIYIGDEEIRFENVRVEKPTITINNKSNIPLMPNEAREKSLTYEFTVYVDVIQRGTVTMIELCTIPAMVGSSVCHLYDKSESERIALKEIVNDPGGYFIINGKERVITGQTRITHNRLTSISNIGDKRVSTFMSNERAMLKTIGLI